jgi:hypothetical protein
MTQEQKNRIKESIEETIKHLERETALKCFDKYQSKDRQDKINFYSSHLIKLANMIA